MPAESPHIDASFHNDYSGQQYTVRSWLYDVAVFIFDIVFTIFFREIKVSGAYHVPRKGTPTILVCAPHANQFIDPCLVMSRTRKIAGSRSKQTCFITAAGSIKSNKFVKLFASWTGGIPVTRVQDNLKPVAAHIKLYVPDYDSDPTLVKLVSQEGSVDALSRFSAKSLIGLPGYLGNAQIESVIDDETIRLRKPFADTDRVRACISKPTCFLYAERIDNSKVFEHVFNHLHTKGCVGIFPEGGSHDRPSLLPIKAGVAIMALGAVAADPTMEVHVVPCGLHYFHRHKFRSRATLEYTEPIVVTGAMGAEYLKDARGAISSLLKRIEQALYSVTVNADDYDTLMAVQTARRLYQPSKRDELGPSLTQIGNNGSYRRIPLSLVVEMNRRLLVGYSKFKDEPRIQNLKKAIQNYNKMLFRMGLKDHQVMELHPKDEKWIVIVTFLIRSVQLFFMILWSLPGVILFSPIFITCNYFSRKKALEGLKKSAVKIRGQDLLATWKIFVALSMAPTLYTVYSLVMVYITRKHPDMYNWLIVSHFIFNSKTLYFFYCYAVLILATYISFITGEMGMDIIKSFPPLIVSSIYPGHTCKKLRETRNKLSQEITQVCNDLGPMVFPDLQEQRDLRKELYGRYNDQANNAESEDDLVNRTRSSSIVSSDSKISNALSRINSRGSLTDIPIFSDIDTGNGVQDEELATGSADMEPIETDSHIASLIRKRRVNEENK
ncbi:unnamed protein product [Kluyveromyces dobzhanskii CBS 2104]|uniref:WGS project CCBQ000000000 data, contig 00011 n=1 Tax=Kluyveromyces dobzhanskii CBS 2104 TaxID=1427455 RepID=A0A0A8L9N6_9SACH|nr:unnamed protein product [Kluyveromyces dobzhanskii CBS 2104]